MQVSTALHTGPEQTCTRDYDGFLRHDLGYFNDIPASFSMAGFRNLEALQDNCRVSIRHAALVRW